jgi:nuclear pore complex protein Nup62
MYICTMYVCTCVRVCARARACVRVCMYICMYVCVCMYVCMYVCVYGYEQVSILAYSSKRDRKIRPKLGMLMP